jgi:general secretion pathway protein D
MGNLMKIENSRTRLHRLGTLLCSVAVTLTLVACQSGNVRQESTASELVTSIEPSPFLLRKLAPGSSGQATKLLPTTSALQPDPTTPLLPCGDGDFALKDLAVKSVSISYQDVDAAIEVLSAMGYTTRIVGGPNANVVAGERFICDVLPVVMLNAEPDDSKMTFFPDDSNQISSQANAYREGASLANLNRIRRSHSGDIDRLMVFFHPEQIQALSRLEDHVHQVVDAPAAQVYIEAWVLEIGEEDSRELGIKYAENIGDDASIMLGDIDGEGDTIDFISDNRIDVDGEFLFRPDIGVLKRVRALVENGKAEILSRPSLLTLSNRQSVIQIVDVIQYPEIETTYQGLSSVTSGVRFGSLSVGITLNLRPRVSADRKWVSLEIDAIVDAEDEENTGQAFQASPTAADDRVLIAEKPGFSSRRVRTFARIPDRTPIIIGGLVTKEKSTISNRVPFFGKIPLIGGLFGFTDKDVTQREIMIVLTPYVLAEEGAGVRSNTPKESKLFDDSDMALFSNRYRLRSEDIFDLSQLTDDRDYIKHEFMARQSVKANPDLIHDAHFAAFLNGDMPGGKALVGRTFFDLAQKLELSRELDLDRIRVSMISGDQIVRTTLKDVIDQAGEQSVVFSVGSGRATGVLVHLDSYQGDPGTAAVRIDGKSDADRFVNALIAREIIALNGGIDSLKIRHIQLGQFIELPDFEKSEYFAVDSETLRIFESSLRYEQIVRSSLARAYQLVGSAQ